MSRRNMDRISQLPSELIEEIISLLPTKVAVSTSVLCSEWRCHYRFIDRLRFTFEDGDDADEFIESVNQVLAQRNHVTLKKFALSLDVEIDVANVDGWIHYALQHRVQNLGLQLLELTNWGYWLPRDVFLSRNLRKLKICCQNLIIPSENLVMNLPSVTYLYLDTSFGHGSSATERFENLIRGCPRLEKLVMVDVDWFTWEFCRVSSQTLRTFEFEYTVNVGAGERNRCPRSVSFQTPNLLNLDYFDSVARQYPTLNFAPLARATIRLQINEQEQEESEEEEEEEQEQVLVLVDASAFFTGLNMVQSLYLKNETVQVLTLRCQNIPVFENLRHLLVDCHAVLGWGSLPQLLNNSPILHTLTFNGLFHENANGCGNICPCVEMDPQLSCLSTSPVIVVMIHELVVLADGDEEADVDAEGDVQGEADQDEARFINMVRHMLVRMPNVTNLTIYCVASSPPAKKLRIQQALVNTPHIASPNCICQVL